MSQLELDVQYIKSIASLHSQDFFLREEISPIQLALEEAIRNKTGKSIDITSLIAPSVKQRAEDFKNLSSIIEESKTASSSDNELELDLLKEDLMCIICKGMDVGARNRLLECADCHSLYHQECHRPIVTIQEADTNWLCQNCKDLRKADKSAAPSVAPVTSTIQKVTPSTSNIMDSSSYKNTNVIKSGKRPASPIKSSSGHKVGTGSTTVANPPRSTTTPNINIISAEKKIQIMKKKAAAKQHEKRKLQR